MLPKRVVEVVSVAVAAAFVAGCLLLHPAAYLWPVSAFEPTAAAIAGVALAFLIGAFVGVVVGIFLHECGHLVCGLASGYSLSSFRFLSRVLVRADGRLRLVRAPSAGIGGQCLMVFGGSDRDEMPYLLYHLGGALANLVLCVGAACVAPLFAGVPFLPCALLGFSTANLLSTLTNALPYRNDFVFSDGANIVVLRRNPDARRALRVQLDVTDALAKGVRMGEMPDEWFALADAVAAKDHITATVRTYRCQLQMDELDVDSACRSIEELLTDGLCEMLPGAVLCALYNDYCYCLALDGVEFSEEAAGAPFDSGLYARFAAAMADDISVLRTNYAVCLLREGDGEAAQEAYGELYVACMDYPYPGAAAAELALADEAKRRNELRLQGACV